MRNDISMPIVVFLHTHGQLRNIDREYESTYAGCAYFTGIHLYPPKHHNGILELVKGGLGSRNTSVPRHEHTVLILLHSDARRFKKPSHPEPMSHAYIHKIASSHRSAVQREAICLGRTRLPLKSSSQQLVSPWPQIVTYLWQHFGGSSLSMHSL